MRMWIVVALALQGCGTECLDAPSGPFRVDFADTEIGARVLELVQVQNTCEDPLSVSSIDLVGDAELELDEGPDSLAGLSDSPMALAFTAAGYGTKVAELTLDTANGPLEIVLTGNADPDQDGDGVNAVQAGGDDCDDSNPNIVGPTEEVVNGRDDDCDGLVDEGFVSTGEVVITEIMISPLAVEAPAGQWIELRNETPRTLDIGGWTLSGPAGVLTLEPDTRISGGETLVVGFEADTTLNGGVELDALLLGDGKPLPTQGWFLTLAVDDQAVAVLSDNKWPEEAGSSIVLDPLITNPAEATRADSWCTSTTALPTGDRATPGAANDICPQFDHDGDGVSGAAGDCDDTDRDISPIAADVWDGIDNNCDGVVDLMLVPLAADGAIQGATNTQMGRDVEIFDYDGDGDLEALVVGGGGGSRLQHIAGESLIGPATTVADVLVGEIRAPSGGGSVGQLTGVTPPWDADGDGDTDIVVLGRAANFYNGSTSFDYLWVFEELPTDVDNDLLVDADPILTLNDPKDGYGSDGVDVLLDVDMDGDGTLDPVFGHGSFKGDTSNEELTNYGKVWLLDLEGQSGRVDPADLAWASWTGETADTSIGDALEGGDIDDDGYDDVIIMDLDRNRELAERRMMVIPGAVELPEASTFAADTPLTISGLAPTTPSSEDIQAPLLADVDDDGTIDLAIPDPTGGGVRIFYDASSLSGDIAATDADLTISGPGGFGTELRFGDVRGDGVPDLLVGAPLNSNGQNGRAYLFESTALGGGGEIDQTAAIAAFGASNSGGFGTRVRLVDIDQDGSDEMIVPDDGSFGFNGGLFIFVAPTE